MTADLGHCARRWLTQTTATRSNSIHLGTVGESRSTSGQLNVDKDVTISGPGADHLAVDGNAQSRVFYVNAGKTVTIDGLTVENGYSGDFLGGGIYIDGAHPDGEQLHCEWQLNGRR